MYQWVVFVHILAALIWVGGMFFLALVLVPVLRGRSRAERAELLGVVGTRFRTVGWVAIITLLVTGVWNLRNRRLDWDVILSTDLFDGRWGQILLGKLTLVAILIAISAVHDFVIGPASVTAARDADPTRAESLRRTASWLARVNALLVLVVIFLAVALVRGLPW